MAASSLGRSHHLAIRAVFAHATRSQIESRAHVTIASGARLGPYEIVSPLGAGGMGEVYRAKDIARRPRWSR